jgi:multiple antibiotic resistance protein
VLVEKAIADLMILFATVDPIGTLAMFVGLTSRASPRERLGIAVKAVGFGGLVLLAFIVLGQLLLQTLGVRLESFQLAGGLIFLLFGIQMVFGTGSASNSGSPEPDHDVAIFPLAVPSIASPGSILAVVLLTDNSLYTIPEQVVTAGLLLLVLAVTLCGLLLATPIFRVLGRSGANLLVRVLGLILASLAVEMILEAVLAIASQMPSA